MAVAATHQKLLRFAFQAYPAWLASHLRKGCPDTLADLSPHLNGEDTNDSWGRPIRMMCGANLPADAIPPGMPAGPTTGIIAMMSVGPDGEAGTDDDVKSWK